MQKKIVGLLCALAFSSFLLAQPKVAVLDTLIDSKMDPAVIVPVTEKIIERFVMSGSYKVLDRSNIRQVLSEREFQLSGLVSDAEITQAGRFLGADYVVVPRVQLLADTYFLTCKMINVETGVIANQASTEGEGKLSVLLGMADRVGGMMSGSPGAAPAGTAASQTQAPPSSGRQFGVVQSKTEVADQAAVDAKRIGTRLYIGLGGGSHTMEYAYWNPVEFLSGGVEVYALGSIWKSVLLTGGLTYLEDTEDFGLGKTTISLGLGFGLPLGILMPWASLNFGVPVLDWIDLDEPFVGAEFSFDVGTDLRLGSFLVGLRYNMASAAIYDGFDDYLYISSSAFWLMAGFRF